MYVSRSNIESNKYEVYLWFSGVFFIFIYNLFHTNSPIRETVFTSKACAMILWIDIKHVYGKKKRKENFGYSVSGYLKIQAWDFKRKVWQQQVRLHMPHPFLTSKGDGSIPNLSKTVVPMYQLKTELDKWFNSNSLLINPWTSWKVKAKPGF